MELNIIDRLIMCLFTSKFIIYVLIVKQRVKHKSIHDVDRLNI